MFWILYKLNLEFVNIINPSPQEVCYIIMH